MTVKTQCKMLLRWTRSGAGLATLSGLGAFSLALTLLSVQGFGVPLSSAPVPDLARLAASPPVPPTASGSLSQRIQAGHLAVGIRLKADSVSLASVHVGAVLDVLATLPDGPDGPGLVGAVVTGARVVAATPSSDHADVLLDAPADQAMLLGHLVRGSLPLAYTVREQPDEPREFSVLTTDEARAWLKLAPRVMAPSPVAAPALAAMPLLPAAPEASEVHFVVYTGVDLELIEQRFGVSEAALVAANPHLLPSEPLAAGTELVVPDLYGFFYRVQPADTLNSLSQRYDVSPERVRSVNGLADDHLPLGEGVLIPTRTPEWALAPRPNGL